MLKVRTSAEKVLKKCGKSAEKVRIGAEKVRESAEKCESDPFSHTIELFFFFFFASLVIGFLFSLSVSRLQWTLPGQAADGRRQCFSLLLLLD